MSSNGKAPTSLEDKVDLLITVVESLVDTIEELKAQQEEINERIQNLSLPGLDFEFEES